MKTNAYAATHDGLTGLPNKFLFLDRLEQATIMAERSTSRFALLIVSINNYPVIHDEYGQIVSDHLILKVAECLQETLREPDTIARIKDNAFAILLPNIKSQLILTQLIWRIEKMLTKPFQIDANEVQLSIGMGQGTYPYDGANASTLLQYVELKIKKPLQQTPSTKGVVHLKVSKINS